MGYTWVWWKNRQPLYVSIGGGTLTFSFAGKEAVSFDGEGRLVNAWLDHVTYRRALDNRILAKQAQPGGYGRRKRWFLDTPRRRQVVRRAYALAGRVADGLARNVLVPCNTPTPIVQTVNAWLKRVLTWTWERLEQERERFYQVYKPIPILPPDQYLAVVLQATEGCSYNRCTFCTFYRDRAFRIKGTEEFRNHVRAVTDFLGRGLEMRRSVFLADANAIIIPQQRLIPLLEVVRESFPFRDQEHGPSTKHGWAPDGIYAFVSAPDALRKSEEDFRALRALGLVRVYIGLETGHDPLRAFLLKEGTAGDVLEAVRIIRQSGVQVGVICMVGIGGERYREAHFQDTITLLRRMPLGQGDVIYLSPFVPSPETPYVYDAAEAGICPLSPEGLFAEVRRFQQALRPWARRQGVIVSLYDIREFVY